MSKQLIGLVRATRKGQKMEVGGEAVGVDGRDGRNWYRITVDEQGVTMCSCPSWKFQGGPVASRVCKHMRKLRETTESTIDVKLFGRDGEQLAEAA